MRHIDESDDSNNIEVSNVADWMRFNTPVNKLKQTIKELRIENLNQYRTICTQIEEINRLKG